jgi:hypothetical protein
MFKRLFSLSIASQDIFFTFGLRGTGKTASTDKMLLFSIENAMI